MSTNRTYSWKISRAGSIGLLAGCLSLVPAASVFAQETGVSQQSQRSDGDVQSSVASAIANDPTLQGQRITTTVAQGQVTLSGTVQTGAQRQQAETLAANVNGISGILNNIKVTNPGSGSAANSDLAAQQAANTLAPQDQQNQQNAPADASQVPPPPPPDQTPQSYTGARQPYPGNGYQGNGYAPQQGNYNPPPQPSGPVTIPVGTLLRVRLNEPLDTAQLKDGAYFQATAATDVYQGGALAIPRGAVLTGQVVESKKGGPFGGSATLRLQLTTINLEGHTFPLASDVWSNKGPNKAGYTAANTVGGAALGAIIGGIAGRGAGAAIGAGIGGAAGLGASAATSGPRLYLPVESQIDFHLTSPATVQPVSWQEAQRLASTSQPAQQPRLYRRPVVVAPYGSPYYYGPVYPGW
jgi:hypothetical protein